jgi:PncC family amidohydrolase
MERSRLEELIRKLKSQQATLSIAESITAGLAISELSNVPGISDVLLGGMISYKRETKEQLLDVPSSLIDEKSAESQEVTTAMAFGLKKLFNSSITVAVTGAASEPSTQSGYRLKVKVGTVFVTVILHQAVFEYEKHFEGGPSEIRSQTVNFIYEKIEELSERLKTLS